MTRAVVVANGSLPEPALYRGLVEAADIVVAADGGARALLESDMRPDLIVGDMDSLPRDLLVRWRTSGGAVVAVSPVKDETDLELALREAMDRGARSIAILGALGGRADHATANLLLLASDSLREVDVAILDAETRVTALRGGESMRIHGTEGDLVTLLPVTERAEGIVTAGLLYPLNGETLPLGLPRGVSNVLVGREAGVRLDRGILLVFQIWSKAVPLTWWPTASPS